MFCILLKPRMHLACNHLFSLIKYNFWYQAQRIKQRRSLKLNKLRESESNIPKQEFKNSKGFGKRTAVNEEQKQSEESPAKKQKLNGKINEKHGHIQQKVHGEPISSLFKHNPEIPSVKRLDKRGVKIGLVLNLGKLCC